MDIEKISNLIKTKRKDRKLTQEELANKLGVTEKAISRWGTGRGTPDISLLIPLSKELKIEVSELLSGEENKNITKNIEAIIEYEEKSKKIRNKKPFVISIIIYLLVIFLFLYYLKYTYSDVSWGERYLFHLLVTIVFSSMIIFANWNLYTNYFDKEIDKNKLKKVTYAVLLVLYIMMILNMTIFDRHMSKFVWQGWDNYYKYGGLNIIPFRTILKYIIEIKQYWPRFFIINIFGNISIFMPVQYFMIKVFGNLSFKKYLLINIIMISLIEILQFVTSCGSLDIDDLILNVFGMSILYYLYIKRESNEEVK
ncbi:MAG: VanZ family protein [Bacilli bacterium]|nr:VanZ family protein [Bacilli bacterium]